MRFSATSVQLLSFQIGFDDAEYISQQFERRFCPPDLVSLSKYTAYTHFSSTTCLPRHFHYQHCLPSRLTSRRAAKKFKKFPVKIYKKKRELVEDKIKRWSEGDGKG